ncbi:MAG: ABC transporter permease [Pauljensenia sp.]
MYRYLFRRLLNYVVLLFIAVTIAYFLAGSSMEPRATFDWTNPNLNKAAIIAQLTDYNLNTDVPLLERYRIWFGNVFTSWDWGMTPKGEAVNTILGTRIWVSVRLISIASFVGILGGVALGAWTATRQYKVSDRVVSIVSLIIISTPTIVIATILQILATRFNQSTGLNWFEFIGETGRMGSYPGAELVDRLQHLLLPTISMSLGGIATYSRYQRNLMLDTLGADYVRTARAKGLTKGKAMRRHALRTALVPMATYFAFVIAGLFTGAAITEQVYSWHGMGIYSVTSITGQDINGTVAVVAFSAACTFFGLMLSDVFTVAVDPRVRVS